MGIRREEILEATAVALALSGSIADWPARFVFKVLEKLEGKEKKENNNSKTS
jgi:hypothetical protein